MHSTPAPAAQPTQVILVLFAFVALLSSSCAIDTGAGPATVEIIPSATGFELQVNGRPYFIRGAVGNQYLDALLAAGANSIRRVNITSADFSRAERLGFTVLAGIELGNAVEGFDYGDRQAVQQQMDGVRATVERFRDEPSLLLWALGDGVDSQVAAEERIQRWEAIDELARAVRQDDPNHPVIVVISEEEVAYLSELAQCCPALDTIGINAVEMTPSLPETLAEQQWAGAYLVTALGPRSDWAVGTTAWGIPLQADSTVRARRYLESYEAVAGQPNSLGSYAALWADDQEPARSWQGMFLSDGSTTGVLDAMTYAWSGAWPVNRAPEIGPDKITFTLEDSAGETGENAFPPGTTLHCAVDVSDPEGDPMIVRWELVAETDPRANSPVAGEPIDDAVVVSQMYRSVIHLPDEPGDHRLFAYVSDSKGSAAAVNVPIRTAAGF